MLPRFFFALYEVSINHTLTFKPGFDSLVWAAYAPLFFVIGGVLVAPSFRNIVCNVLSVFKIVVASYNIYSIIDYLNKGGNWSALDPNVHSPLWWNITIYILAIILLTLLPFFYVHQLKLKGEAMVFDNKEGYFYQLWHNMRLNIIWYGLLLLIIISCIIVPNAISAYNNFKIIFHNFTFAIFVSPSAYLFLH